MKKKTAKQQAVFLRRLTHFTFPYNLFYLLFFLSTEALVHSPPHFAPTKKLAAWRGNRINFTKVGRYIFCAKSRAVAITKKKRIFWGGRSVVWCTCNVTYIFPLSVRITNSSSSSSFCVLCQKPELRPRLALPTAQR